jgi:hypothetical protein
MDAGANFELQYRSVAHLKNNLGNARTHSKPQIKQIANSIKAFGFTNPVLIDKDNTVIAGHGRQPQRLSLRGRGRRDWWAEK